MKNSRLLLLAALVLAVAGCAQGYNPSESLFGGQQFRFYDGGTTMRSVMPDERPGPSQY